jgi:hypothetical protein
VRYDAEMASSICRGCGVAGPSPPSRSGCAKCARLSLDLWPGGSIHPALRVVEDTPARFVVELDRKAESDPSWFLPLIGLPFLFPFAFVREGWQVALAPFMLVCVFGIFGIALFAHRKSHRTTLEIADGRLESKSLSIFTRTTSIALADVRDLVSSWYVATKAGKGAQLAAMRRDDWPVVLWFNVKDGAIVACAERMLRERLPALDRPQ